MAVKFEPHGEPPAAVPATRTNDEELDRLLADIQALEALADDWPEQQRNAAQARITAVDALNAEAFRRLIRGLNAEPGAKEALRAAVSDELVYAVLRRHGLLKASLFERVEAALDTVRPMLASHGGDVELVEVTDGTVRVRFLGACDGCPASAMTFHAGVQKAVQAHVPEIVDVQQVRGLGAGTGGEVQFTSPFANNDADDWLDVTGLDALREATPLNLEVAGHGVLLTRFGDRVTCFENACAHMGMPMDGGNLANGILECPHHGFRYSLQSGECLTAPEVQLQPHAVRVLGDRVQVQLSR